MPAQTVEVEETASFQTDLLNAMPQNELALHYQIIVDKYSHTMGVEALLRWKHPTRGSVSPAKFIAVAEKSGLILEIGDWVLESACSQLQRWANVQQWAHVCIAVNVSARQFGQTDFVQKIIQKLQRYQIHPSKLKLELTESSLLTDIDDAIEKMTELQECGVGFALDDFGTGYSSLSYLSRLPFEQLKIDQSFVRNIFINKNDAAIAIAIINLAHSLGLTVVAEGVETYEQFQFLLKNGCDKFQGYLFATAVTAENVKMRPKLLQLVCA
jgi:EAL domain-containing protein (putative c-di-GMP-specific phosphodiesterase class I)